MSEITWQQIGEQAHLTALENAIESWDAYIGKIQEQAEAIGGDVTGTISEDSFGDETGDACRAQLSTIAGSLEDHLSEAAEKIKTALDDAREGLSTCHDDMQELIGEVLDAKYLIENDEVDLSDARLNEIIEEVRAANFEGAQIETEARERAATERTSKADPMTERLTAIVEAARGHDDDAVAALGGVGAGSVVSPPPIGADWHEDVAQYWADEAADLIGGGEDGELSSEELDEFNELVAARGDVPQFATALMQNLGPGGLMSSIADVSNGTYGDEATFTQAQLDAMYESMGLALSTATDPTNQPHVHQAWVADLMNLGAGNVHTSDGSFAGNGYKLLAPALPHGVYHEDFLVPVTEHLLALDTVTDWHHTQPMGNGDFENPINYALEAIDHNPAAALNLFTEGGVGLEDIEGVDLDGVFPVTDPYEHLISMAEHEGAAAPIDPNLLGDALEAASTGVSTDPERPYGSDERLQPNEERATFTERLIADTIVEPERFVTGNLSEMLDNFAGITTTYIDDFQRELSSESVNWAANWGGVALSFDRVAGLLPDGRDPMSNWLWMIGHDEAAMGEVWGASEALLHEQLGRAPEHYNGQSSIAYGNAFEMHNRLTADLTVGALDGIATGEYEAAGEKDKAVDSFATGAKFAAGVTAGYFTGPWTGAAVGEISGRMIDGAFGFAKVSDEELLADLQEAVGGEGRAQYEERMNESGTLDRINQVMEADPTMNADDREAMTENFYEQYWDRIEHSELRHTDREPIDRTG